MKEGFTMVELSLSLVFISILSLMVVVVIMNSVSAYHKSLTLNQLNTVGTSIIDDMRASVQASSGVGLRSICDRVDGGKRSTCDNDHGLGFVSVTRKEKVSGGKLKNDAPPRPVFGAFCTGSYSYIWNSGYFFSSDYKVGSGGVGSAKLTYKKAGGSEQTIEGFRLLKVRDVSRAVCTSVTQLKNNVIDRNTYNLSSISNDFNIARAVVGDNPIELSEDPEDLLENEGGLALYNLTTDFALQQGVGKNVYYYSTFVLSTITGGADIKASGDYCVSPEGGSSGLENFDYCAINKFNFAAMANGGYNNGN